MRWLGGILALTIAASAPAQQAPAPDPQGVWQGMIGTLPVHVCFATRPSGRFGAYFYRSKMVPIPLLPEESRPSTYSEGWPDNAKLPRWTLTNVQPRKIEGSWRQGARNLPIRLTRVPMARLDEFDTPCGSTEFQQPRVEGIRIARSRAAKDSLSYTRLVLDHRGRLPEVSVESFDLDGSSKAVKRINSRLRQAFADGEESWLSCIRSAYNSSPFGGDHNESYVPRMVSRRWLSVMHHWDGFCGGAHPSSSSTAVLFDRETGREVDLFGWLNAKAIKRERIEGLSDEVKTLTPAFREHVLSAWKAPAEAEECDEVIRSQDHWSVELTHTGLTFTPDLVHAVQACGEDFAMPFARLATYLSPEGQRHVAAMRAENR